MMKRLAVGYEFICRIIMMVAVVNVAFVLHTLFGLIVVGLLPSVAASYSVFRQWLLDVEDRSWTIKRTWTAFHQAWLEEIGTANKLGWPQMIIWLLLIWEYWFVQNNNLNYVGTAISGVLLLINVLYGLFVFLSWSVHVNFSESLLWTVRTSFAMIIARPVCSFVVLVLFLATVCSYYTWPGLMMAFGPAVPIFFTMLAVYSWGRMPGMDIHTVEPLEKKR